MGGVRLFTNKPHPRQIKSESVRVESRQWEILRPLQEICRAVRVPYRSLENTRQREKPAARPLPWRWPVRTLSSGNEAPSLDLCVSNSLPLAFFSRFLGGAQLSLLSAPEDMGVVKVSPEPLQSRA